ncbi:MAG TPA: hypothetical protein VE219_02085, partial [Candidatus Sulfotelmatobacter sp.]|nr:hypothetical protein [Candidatus Sulfotelmatobacter sp.]
MTAAVHQLLAVFSRGDAIGNAALRTQAILRRLGYRSEIFANAIDEHLTRQARPAAMAANLGQDDALIYHLSIGSPAAEIFRRTS